MRKNRIIKRAVTGLALAAMMSLTVPAMAMSFTGDPNWSVTFNQDNNMEENFKAGQIQDVMNQMEPGDDATITLTLKNDNDTTTDWYMTNEVIESLEESAKVASGGAYSYYLSYNDDVLYDSTTVGGEGTSKAGVGLHQATNALDDFIYLDTLKKGESGKITLKVALDGETQGNDYQDTLAKLQMQFAVELAPEGTTVTKNNVINQTKVVKTGDQNMSPYAIAGGIAGVILLVLAIMSAKRRRQQMAAAEMRRSGKGAGR
ncbi:MAG: LPXTG cell wall anchor domain-containing protein [Lachnospiraceae bacterium]|nr:LPXTG cell wall anchor domain-containing protein [Lachnospiraceae bacterium]